MPSALVLGFVVSLTLAACAEGPPYTLTQQAPMTLTVDSESMVDGAIGVRQTCKGLELSPQLRWDTPPEEAVTVAVVFESSANGRVHWLVYNVPAGVGEMPEGVHASPQLANGARHGFNDFNRIAYTGPCAERDAAEVGDYAIYLYALDVSVDLAPGATRNQLLEAMDGHIVSAGGIAASYRPTP